MSFCDSFRGALLAWFIRISLCGGTQLPMPDLINGFTRILVCSHSGGMTGLARGEPSLAACRDIRRLPSIDNDNARDLQSKRLDEGNDIDMVDHGPSRDLANVQPAGGRVPL